MRHLGLPYFNAGDLPQQTLEGIHRLLRLELPLTVDVLETLLFREGRSLFAAGRAMRRVGQLYAELKRRAGEGWRCSSCNGSYGCCAIAPRRWSRRWSFRGVLAYLPRQCDNFGLS